MVIFDYYAIDYLNQRLADVILFLSLLTLLKLRLSSRRKPAMQFHFCLRRPADNVWPQANHSVTQDCGSELVKPFLIFHVVTPFQSLGPV